MDTRDSALVGQSTDAPPSRITQARQLDLFIAPLADLSLRDQRDVMERPFFALSKRRTTPIVYKSPKGDVTLEISPNVTHGMATIWDFDILIWAASQINAMQERKEADRIEQLRQTRTLYFQPADLLRAIGRGTSGRDRDELRRALDRLASTYVKTNIRQHHQGRSRDKGFHWLDGWEEESDTRTGQSKGMSIALAEWFMMGVFHQQMLLQISDEYFGLTGGYERWLYRIARKHAHGTPEGWTFDLATLHDKSGSDQPLRFFKRDLRKVIERGPILGYAFEWIEREAQDPQVRIYPVAEDPQNQQRARLHAGTKRRRTAQIEMMENPGRFEQLLKPQELHYLHGLFPDHDIGDLFNRFVVWNKTNGSPPLRDVLKAFVAFAQTHIERQRSATWRKRG
jgi:plasmid replication initiation protein